MAINPEIAAEMDMPIVHTFPTYTSGLKDCLTLLTECGIKTVSMESTSVYWKNLYDVLEGGGLEVCLVNPKKFRMVPGRKTDVLDCQWLQTLHMYGLLSGSFIPTGKVRALRCFMRERDKMLKDRSKYLQRMQKAMVEMNLMLVNVVSDIGGKTGIAIIEAILAGERDSKKLAALRDGRIKKSEEEIGMALEGNYKDEQLYVLKSNYEIYRFLDQQLKELDAKIVELLESFPLALDPSEPSEKPVVATPPTGRRGRPKGSKKARGRGKNDIRTEKDIDKLLFGISGVDLTTITGLQANSLLQIMSEVGTDMSKFPTAKHFASYLGFTPHNKVTGGVTISSKTDRIKSYAAQAFKKVVPSISQGKSALAAFYHRIVGKKGVGKAIVAVCRKLAMIYWNVLTNGTSFIEHGNQSYQAQQEAREKALLAKLAKKHKMELTPNLQ